MGLEIVEESVETPIGRLSVFLTPRGICRLTFGVGAEPLGPRFADVPVVPGRGRSAAARALCRYFGGELHALEGLEVDVIGTPFQLQVWKLLRTIPPGHTLSYADVAQRVKHPRGFRAVGMANRSNPVPLVIPCHRVIAADGTLGGYSPGVDLKIWLLRHEGYLLT
jgi:methylated-DNA-[protein]-cysteine S-methyltransferase